ncbi:MAG: hypothetical protein COY58_05860 [Gammaproteobacteria bacterium CG_4_10_14_0_8_um_filter_38_16]|nr:MAG: hypothetical protein COY58_05860 [Gammaproteobacteria bacterium CG_4_10_14_0_8_um_filter_38_16]PJA04412.1 MAG: hypothetical protein COX72_00470 [Gammaproteobacteria bacterium CG_4_10_14_0_2_um_filter_38_22]PJB10166.1 MAG: hypothetical protein CO120_06110 [Gammaproteobacteria bacterium CG_4_9_14_3_um_filter_38_9]
MEYLKVRNDLIYILNPVLFLMGLFLFIEAPTFIAICFYAFWFALCCALFFIFSRYGKQRLAHNADDIAIRLPLSQWLFCIVLLQLTFLGVYLGIATISGNILTVNTHIRPYLFLESLSTQFFASGLFPWAMYAVIAAGMGLIGYKQQTNAYFSTLLEPLTHHQAQQTWGLIINTGMRRATLMVVGITLMFMTILLISLVLPPNVHLPNGFQSITIFSTLILIVFTFTKAMKRYITRIFSHRVPTAIGFPIFCAALALLLLFVIISMSAISSQALVQNIPSLITNWINLNWNRLWILFSGMWCAALTPLVCSYIARISRGYRIRDIILGVLALPILMALFFVIAQYLHLPRIILPLFTVKIIALISFLIFLPLLLNHKQIACAIIAYFPKNGTPKPRDYQPFFQKITQFAIISLYFYLVLGMNGLSFLIFTINFYILGTLLFGLFAILINSIRSKETR